MSNPIVLLAAGVNEYMYTEPRQAWLDFVVNE